MFVELTLSEDGSTKIYIAVQHIVGFLVMTYNKKPFTRVLLMTVAGHVDVTELNVGEIIQADRARFPAS
jgi:hypothetical protein